MLEHKAAGSQIRRPAEKQDVLPKDLTLYPSIREFVISFDGNCSVSIWRLVFDPFPSSRVFTTVFLVPSIVSAHQLLQQHSTRWGHELPCLFWL